jgi:hypothetical protein
MTAQTKPPWFDEYLDAERDRPARIKRIQRPFQLPAGQQPP